MNDATLALVRHGQTTWVAEGRFQGSADPPLSEIGRRQAASVAERLRDQQRELSLPLPAGGPRAIWHSPLARATSTAGAIGAALGPDVPLLAEPGLVELAQGDWEGRTLAEVTAGWATELDAWRTDPVRHQAPGGEPLTSGAARAAAAIRRILLELGSGLREDWAGGPGNRSPVLGYVDTAAGGPADPVEPLAEPWALVVAHDGILRLVLMELLEMSLDHYWALPFGLCAVTVVEIRSGRARLRAHNIADHLPV